MVLLVQPRWHDAASGWASGMWHNHDCKNPGHTAVQDRKCSVRLTFALPGANI